MSDRENFPTWCDVGDQPRQKRSFLGQIKSRLRDLICRLWCS